MSTTEDRQDGLEIYELGYLILPSVNEDKLDKVVDSIKEIIKGANGSEVASEDPFKHPLAYSMSKTIGSSRYVVNEAYLGWIKFEVEPSSVAKIKVNLEKVDGILRFLLIKAPRESLFTFAKAREKLLAEEIQSEELVEGQLDSTDGLAKEQVVE